MKYRKKPVVIEAFQWSQAPEQNVPYWFTQALRDGRAYFQGGVSPYVTIQTSEGAMRASPGDWIIQGIKGELYPCKPDIFAATYEPAE